MSLLKQTMTYEEFESTFKGISSSCIGKETGYSVKTIEKFRRDRHDFTGTTAIVFLALKEVKDWLLLNN